MPSGVLASGQRLANAGRAPPPPLPPPHAASTTTAAAVTPRATGNFPWVPMVDLLLARVRTVPILAPGSRAVQPPRAWDLPPSPRRAQAEAERPGQPDDGLHPMGDPREKPP